MSLRIIATRLTEPDAEGYPDKCKIIDESNGMEVWATDRFRTNPNPYKPGYKGSPWWKFYAQILARKYTYEYYSSDRHGICLLLNGGAACSTTKKNPKQNDGMVAFTVEIHRGFSDTWPGSSACQTVHPDDWEKFIGHFKIGDNGIYEIVS